MSVRHSLLAILAAEPTHGYGLKSTFDRSTAGAWPLNVGQVYTTLNRLERDGLVEASELGAEELASASSPERRAWRITDAGRQTLAQWYESPVDDRSTRDELVIKVLVAIATGEVELTRVLQTQRTATMRRLQEYTRRKADADPDQEMPWILWLDSLILRAEAEVRWLDLCEQRLRASGSAS